tara:strand:- start:1260 stop:1640 length:381 start_codon:yes stop_codon:yes gene_type:complete
MKYQYDVSITKSILFIFSLIVMLGAYALSIKEGDSLYFWVCWTIPLLTVGLLPPNSLASKLLVQIPLAITIFILGFITFGFLFSDRNVGASGLIYALPMFGFFPVSFMYYIVVGTYLVARPKKKNI